VLTADALKRLEIPTEKFSNDLPKMVKAGLDRLAALQREDGGWGWFDRDATDSVMTGYAVAGLSEARRLGYVVDSVMFDRAIRRALALAREEQDLNRLAWICLALSRGTTVPDVERLVAKLESLSPFALAVTSLALHRWGRPEAAAFRSRLSSLARESHWVSTSWTPKWEVMDVETTALAVTALCEAEPDHPAIAPAVEWLLAQRSGNRWRSTKDTAAAIHAILSHAMATGGRLDALAQAVASREKRGSAPAHLKKVAISLNGIVKDFLVDLNDPTSCRFECHFAGGDVKAGENRFEIVSDEGFVFDIEGTLRTTGNPPAPGTAFSLRATTDRPLDKLRIGEEVTVALTVAGDAAYDYVMIEVPVPAGCEVIAGSGDGPFSRFEARYEGALFYLRSCGTTPTAFRFKMRCAFAGRYLTLAPSAEVMYDARLSGAGQGGSAEIKP
jgi:uncharacterized protein YfaS (alpha-2-macroglobulin family)